jgi:hypothetical protein
LQLVQSRPMGVGACLVHSVMAYRFASVLGVASISRP